MVLNVVGSSPTSHPSDNHSFHSDACADIESVQAFSLSPSSFPFSLFPIFFFFLPFSLPRGSPLSLSRALVHPPDYRSRGFSRGPSLPLTRACAFIILYYCPSSPLLPAPVLSPPFSPSAPPIPSPRCPNWSFLCPKATFFASFFKKPLQIFGGMEKSAYLCTRKRERDTPAVQGL